MSKLEPRLEALRQKYALDPSSFWQLPQNGTWIIKHQALESVAEQAGITWGKVTVIESDIKNGVAAMLVVGFLPIGDDVVEQWSTGEASPKNCKNSYPMAMAEKRARDRVVLKLMNIHGLLYSEDEIDTTTSAAQKKRGLKELEADLVDAKTEVSMEALKETWRAIMRSEGWDKSYIEEGAKRIAAREHEIKEALQ